MSQTGPTYPVQLTFSSATPQFGLIPDGDVSKEVFMLFESLDEIPPIGGLPNQLVNLLAQTYNLTGPVMTSNSQEFTVSTITAGGTEVDWEFSLADTTGTTQHTFGGLSFVQDPENTKWTIKINNWPWLSSANSINMRIRIWSNYGDFVSSSSQVNSDGTTTFFLHTQSTQVAVTLISFAMVGATQVGVPATFLTDSSVLILNFPYFGATGVEYDPDIGVLVTPQDSGSGTNDVLIIVLSVVIPVVVVPILALVAVLVALYVIHYVRRRTLQGAGNRDSINTDSFEYAAHAADEAA